MLPLETDRRYLADNVPTGVCPVQPGLLEHLSLPGRGGRLDSESKNVTVTTTTKTRTTQHRLGKVKLIKMMITTVTTSDEYRYVGMWDV